MEEVCLIFQVEDFLHPEEKISLFREETPVRTDSSLLSSLYFYWVSNDQSGKVLTPSEIRAQKTALKCVKVGTLHYALCGEETHLQLVLVEQLILSQCVQYLETTEGCM